MALGAEQSMDANRRATWTSFTEAPHHTGFSFITFQCFDQLGIIGVLCRGVCAQSAQLSLQTRVTGSRRMPSAGSLDLMMLSGARQPDTFLRSWRVLISGSRCRRIPYRKGLENINLSWKRSHRECRTAHRNVSSTG